MLFFGVLLGLSQIPLPKNAALLEFAVGVVFAYNASPWMCQDLGLCKAIQIVPLPWSVSLELVSWLMGMNFKHFTPLRVACQNSITCIPGTFAIH